MSLLQWSSSHSILSECRWVGEPELIPKFLIMRTVGRIRSVRSVAEHCAAQWDEPQRSTVLGHGGKPGLLIISNSSLASLQTKCHLVPTGGVLAGSLTRWWSKQWSIHGKALYSNRKCQQTHCTLHPYTRVIQAPQLDDVCACSVAELFMYCN